MIQGHETLQMGLAIVSIALVVASIGLIYASKKIRGEPQKTDDVETGLKTCSVTSIHTNNKVDLTLPSFAASTSLLSVPSFFFFSQEQQVQEMLKSKRRGLSSERSPLRKLASVNRHLIAVTRENRKFENKELLQQNIDSATLAQQFVN